MSIAATTLWDSEWPVVRDPWGGVPSAGQTETTATDLWPSGLGRFDSANSNDMQKLTIAIDGPAGSGKSSVARRVAGILGYLYLDSGAMYRALALKALQRNVPLEEESQLEELAAETRIELQPPTAAQEKAGAKNRVFLDGQEVTDAIRSSEVAQAASRLATIAGVRRVLVAEQQRAGEGGGVVMEGRDIGTVVFPNAELKIFLEASPEVRAERRWKEHQEKGDTLTIFQVLEEVRERDRRDRERKVSPLVRATDAVLVDNTAMDVDETARLIVMLAGEREKETVSST
jgi:cytidylate kinase